MMPGASQEILLMKSNLLFMVCPLSLNLPHLLLHQYVISRLPELLCPALTTFLTARS